MVTPRPNSRTADMIVAVTALEYGMTLVTNNRKDFPIEGLLLWTE